MRYRKTIEVAAPLDAAFAYVADFGRAAEWDPGLLESRRLDEAPLGVGSAFHIVADVRGKAQEFRYVITAFEPPRRVVIEGVGEQATSRDEVTFEPADTAAESGSVGGTRVTYDVDLRLRGVRRVAEPLLGGFMRDLGNKAIAGLKLRLDARASG